MEKIQNNEQFARREWIVVNLKDRGFEDPETKEVLAAWFKYQEIVRRPEPGSEIDDMIEYALVLKDAGLKKEAKAVLDDALLNAWSGFQDAVLCEKIDGIIDSLSIGE